MSQLSIAFQTDKPLVAYGPLARTVEEYGFDGVSVYNDMLYQPAWLPLLEIAHATERVRIGPAAVNPFTCHPMTIASMIAQIDEASHGRAYLGLARGGWLDYVGLQPEKPVTALREAFESIKHLLSGSREPYEGSVYPIAGGDSLRWDLLRTEIPFLLGTWGVKTIAACARYVQELKIGGTANQDLVPRYRAILDEAAGGQPANIVIGAVSVVDEDGEAARALARREVALYVPIVADLDPTLDIEPELAARIRAAADVYDFEAAGALISDELLKCFAFAGTPEEVAEHVNAVFEAGAGRVELGTPHGLNEEEGLRLLGERVLPAVVR